MTVQRLRSTAALPAQSGPENVKTSPLLHQRTMRTDFKRVITTGFAGQFLPILAIPLLREDRMRMTEFRFGIEMAETEQMLLNPVRAAVHMWFVPKMAFARFKDLGRINRSYTGQAEADATVIPWFDTKSVDANPFFKVMGIHGTAGSRLNSDYIEAYNVIWNYIAEQASPSIAKRVEGLPSIAPAFWMHTALRHVKPTFDQALIHGEVALNVVSQNMPVHSTGAFNFNQAGSNWAPTNNDAAAPPGATGDYNWAGDVWAELQEGGVTVSLSNIELAKRTAAFARARQAYQGLNDDEIIDLLMEGVRVPDEGLRQPILLGRTETVLGMSQRYATDSANLEKSVTRGQTVVDVRATVPQTNTGGIVMGIVEILPEQLYERMVDPYLTAADATELPNRLRDELDLEPVEVMTNGQVDTDHTDPTGVFGYAPLNHRWQRSTPNIGGLYYRPDADALWDENRNRIWAVETVDPSLGDDFYLASNIHHEVFADGLTDPFEISASGVARIEGNTFFGPALRESTGDYDSVEAKADTTRITLP